MSVYTGKVSKQNPLSGVFRYTLLDKEYRTANIEIKEGEENGKNDGTKLAAKG